MNRTDWVVASWLLVLAVFIWLRDTTWALTSEDTLPILVGLPLFYWVGRPWNFSKPLSDFPTIPLVITAALFLVGILINSVLVLTLGWTYLLWKWLTLRTPEQDHPTILKLMILPIMSFPWITLDAQPLGWWFRLSGAYVTGAFYSWLGFNVKVEGTNILIDNLPISVEAACSGLNTLQSMLIAGSLIAFLYLGKTNRYWWNLPVLVVVAWLANTIRIMVISAVAMAFGPEYALGAFHIWGGWFVLLLMFLLCWGLFYLAEPASEEKGGHEK